MTTDAGTAIRAEGYQGGGPALRSDSQTFGHESTTIRPTSERDNERSRDGEHEITDEGPPPSRRRRDEDDDRDHDEHVGNDLPEGIQHARPAREVRRQGACEAGGWYGGDAEHQESDRRRHEQQDIGRPSRPWFVDGTGEDPQPAPRDVRAVGIALFECSHARPPRPRRVYQ